MTRHFAEVVARELQKNKGVKLDRDQASQTGRPDTARQKGKRHHLSFAKSVRSAIVSRESCWT